jgi:CheY-like chemotaxis protein
MGGREARATDNESRSLKSKGCHRSARLLVVDDSMTIRKLVEISFKGASGTSVEFASSGEEGVRRAVANSPDLILLDFVLPDMKGIDVCRRLAAEPRTAAVPILLMTAKGENVRELFRPFPAVVGYVPKPFNAVEIVALVDASLHERRRAPVAAQSPCASLKRKEAAANALFARLRSRFARIPEWLTQIGSTPPAQYFARKILTPDLMDELLTELIPFYRGSVAPVAIAPPSLSGQIGAITPLALWRFIAGTGQSGELAVQRGERRALLYFRQGKLVLVSCNRPEEYAAGARVALEGCGSDALARARAEQSASGKPLYVTLAEAGVLGNDRLGLLLFEQGRRILDDVLDAGAGEFHFSQKAALPLYVDAYGRALSLLQVSLERLRARGNDDTVSDDELFERSPQFSRSVRDLQLTEDERRILAIVDGRSSVAEIAERIGRMTQALAPVLTRLSEVELIRRAGRIGGARAPRRVMILEPDVDGVQRPLAAHLRQVAESIELIDLAAEADVVAAIFRERPRLVIFNAASAVGEAERVARAVTVRHGLDTPMLAAVLDRPVTADIDRLRAAGFHAVLSKPIQISEIESLLW